jgi:tripartite-type tricarboxylate transporter receptor subunit TctC
MAVELLRSMTGINVVHVPYKGSAGIIPALLSGEIDFTIAAVNSLVPHFKSGKLRPIAVASASRTALLPDVPTIAEAGPLPGYAVDVWLGVMAPAGTPRPIIDRLNAEINRVVKDPQVIKERLTPVGLEPVGSTPEQLRKVMIDELAKYTKLAREAHIRPE